MKEIQEINDVCKEVLAVLAYFEDDLIERIPAKVLENLSELAADSKVDFYIDPKQDLDKQDISEQSKDLISLIYHNFVADENQKDELLKLWNGNENKYQEELKEKYNLDNLFQHRKKQSKTAENTSDTAMIEYKKETLFDKIKNFIKSILKVNKE